MSKLHVFGEWFDSSESIHAFPERRAVPTATTQDRRCTTKYLRHTLPRGGKSGAIHNSCISSNRRTGRFLGHGWELEVNISHARTAVSQI